MNSINSSDEFILGINCFNELLLESEIIDFARKNFSIEIESDDLVFYSKRLNLYVE